MKKGYINIYLYYKMQSKVIVDEEGWTVTPKKGKSNSNSNNYIKKNNFIRKDTKLWYNEDSWQHKVLTHQFKYDDGKTVSQKFELDEICERYSKSKNNFHKNRNFKDMMKVLTEAIWNEEKLNFKEFQVEEIKKNENENKEEENEEVENEEVSQVVINKIDYANKSLIKDNKSFASLFKN